MHNFSTISSPPTIVARGKKVKGSVQKINLVAQLIKGLKVADALAQLTFCHKSASLPLKKLLLSAMANGQNTFNKDPDQLKVGKILVGKETALKRISPRARGRAARIKKHYSNITIILEEEHGTKS